MGNGELLRKLIRMPRKKYMKGKTLLRKQRQRHISQNFYNIYNKIYTISAIKQNYTIDTSFERDNTHDRKMTTQKHMRLFMLVFHRK